MRTIQILPAALLAAFLFCTTALTAQTLVSGIFQQTDAKLEYVEGADWNTFLAKNKEFNNKGFRLTDIETAGLGQERSYWGIYTKSSERDTIAKTLGWSDFVQLKRKMADRNFVLTDVTGYALNETDFIYIGVWQPGETAHKIWKLDSRDGLMQRTDEMFREKFVLQGVKVISTPSGQAQFLAIYHFQPIPQRNVVFITDSEQIFNEDWAQRVNSKVRLIDYDRFQEAGTPYYLGVYQAGSYEHLVLRETPRPAFEDQWDRLESKEKLRLVNWWVSN
ncbi:MAG: hypothetical protein WBA17_03905 [Saprospiraceae bacterium]